MKTILIAMVAMGACYGSLRAAPPVPLAAFRIEANTVVTPRQVFTPGDSGLPQQIQIKAEAYELPLEKRGAKLADADLAPLGRGPQLRQSMRIEAVTGGKTVALAAAEAVKVAMDGETAVTTANVSGGGVTATIETRYAKDGAMSVKIIYGGGASVDSLAVVMDIAGPVDTVIAAGRPDAKGLPSAGDDCGLSGEEGIVWGNGKAPASTPATTPATTPTSGPARRPAIARGTPGVVGHMFFGSGDRGWTWLTAGEAGWVIDPAAPTMTLTRDKDGAVTWRAILVNKAAKLDGDKTVAFTLLTHPAAARAAGFRKAAWMELPYAGKAAAVAPLTAEARKEDKGVIRADCAGVQESFASAAALVGPAGGAAASADKTLADTVPMNFFRYLAGTHTCLPAYLATNSKAFVQPGQSEALDRMAIGRALLNDIGLDCTTVVHRALAAKVVTALTQFGYFEDDGKTEYIPYWRSREIVRYGEPFSGADVFSTFSQDPMARVYTSVWRRPTASKKGAQAMLLVVNETDAPVRQQFYVLNVPRLFMGANRLTSGAIAGKLDYTGIPQDSDWSQGKIGRGTDVGVKNAGPQLMDLEDGGSVVLASGKGNLETYGPLFIPAHGFRLLMGASDPGVLTPEPAVEKK